MRLSDKDFHFVKDDIKWVKYSLVFVTILTHFIRDTPAGVVYLFIRDTPAGVVNAHGGFIWYL